MFPDFADHLLTFSLALSWNLEIREDVDSRCPKHVLLIEAMTHNKPWESNVPHAVAVPWLRHVSQTSRFNCLSPVADGDAFR